MAEYRTSIDIAADPDAVFDHLVTEAGLTAWMGVPGAIEAEPDGAFIVDIAGYPVRGRYLEVHRPTRVVFTWGFAGSDDLPPGASTVSVDLVPTPGGTRVELAHTDLPETQVPGHARGWAHYAERLVLAASGVDAGPDRWPPADWAESDPEEPVDPDDPVGPVDSDAVRS